MPASKLIQYDCPIRDVLDRVGDAWTFMVLMELQVGPCRFNALNRVIDGISPRMLSVTLRKLERDGLASRTILPTSPPQVEYAITDRGITLNQAVSVLGSWAKSNHEGIRRSRAKYDQSSE